MRRLLSLILWTNRKKRKWNQITKNTHLFGHATEFIGMKKMKKKITKKTDKRINIEKIITKMIKKITKFWKKWIKTSLNYTYYVKMSLNSSLTFKKVVEKRFIDANADQILYLSMMKCCFSKDLCYAFKLRMNIPFLTRTHTHKQLKSKQTNTY